MARLNISKLKKIASITAERGSRESAKTETISTRIASPRDHKAIAKFFAKNVEGMAATRDQFDARLASNAKKADIEIKKLTAQASKIGRTRKAALANIIKQRASSFEALTGPAINVPSAERYLVTAPFQITGINLKLTSSRIAHLDSWAKFKHADTGGHLGGRNYWGEAVFRFVWENNTDKYVVINANGYMVLHGSAGSGAMAVSFPGRDQQASAYGQACRPSIGRGSLIPPTARTKLLPSSWACNPTASATMQSAKRRMCSAATILRCL